MKIINAFYGGLAGAVALTITHQLLQKNIKLAPRMDLMGEEGLMKIADKADIDIPAEKAYGITMAGDIAGNALYYSLIGVGKKRNAIQNGALLGLAAGVGGVCLPKHIGLTNAYSNRTLTTKMLTVGIYLLGGIVSGVVAKAIKK